MPEETQHRGPVLLTGATGFVGHRLQAFLLDQNYSVRVLVRHGSARAGNVDPRAERIEGSLEDSQALARALAGCKAVVNCAGTVRGNDPEDFVAANVEGVRSLASAIKRLSAPPSLLHLSSLAAKQPQLSNYAASKQQGEKVLEEFPELLWTVFRPPAIYGPGDVEMRPLLNLTRRGLVLVPGGNRQARIALLHVDDLATAVLAWLRAPARYRQYLYEIDDGHPNGYDWTEIAAAVCTEPMFSRTLFLPIPTGLMNVIGRINEQVSRITRRKPMLTTGKVRELTHPQWLCDNAPFARTSGWAPVIALKEGAAALYQNDSAS